MNQTARTTTGHKEQSIAINEGVAQVGTGLIIAMAGGIGLWATACMASALVQYGVAGVVQGWFSAILG